MPTVLLLLGYRFFFFSNEGNEPPHIHLEKADAVAKFWLAPVRLASSAGFSARDLNKLAALVAEHEPLFLTKWHACFNRN